MMIMIYLSIERITIGLNFIAIVCSLRKRLTALGELNNDLIQILMLFKPVFDKFTITSVSCKCIAFLCVTKSLVTPKSDYSNVINIFNTTIPSIFTSLREFTVFCMH